MSISLEDRAIESIRAVRRRSHAPLGSHRHLHPHNRRGATKTVWVMLVTGALLVGFFGSHYLLPPGGLEQGGAEAENPPQADRRQPSSPAAEGAPEDAAPQVTAPQVTAAALPPAGATDPETAEEVIEEASGVLEHLVQRFPRHADAHEIAARFDYWRGDTAAAVKAWERCLDIDSSYAHAYDGLASVAAKRGDHEKAAALYRQSLAIRPDSVRTRTELAKALMAEGESDGAVSVLQETVEAVPSATEAYYQLGVAYQQSEEFAKAKESFESTLELEPRYAAAQIGLARASVRLGFEDEARRHQEKYQQLRATELEQTRRDRLQFDDLQATRQEVAQLYVDAGRIYVSEGDADAAKRLWARAALLDSHNLNSREALAWLYLQQGEPLETIRVLREMSELMPENLAYPLEIARIYAQMNRIAEAEETLKQVCETAPDHAAGYAGLAQLYLQTNRKFSRALELAEKAVELAPEAEHYVLLSGCHERKRNWAEAAEAMARAVELEPENARYRQIHELLQQQIPKGQQP